MLVLGWEHVVALIAALGTLSGVIAAVVSALANRGKVAAEAEHEEAQAEESRASGAAQLVAASSDFVSQLVGRVGDLEKSNSAQAETIQLLLDNDGEKQEKINRLEENAQQQRNMIDGLLETVANLRAEVDRWKVRFERLFEWIRAQGLEPPTMEELERE